MGSGKFCVQNKQRIHLLLLPLARTNLLKLGSPTSKEIIDTCKNKFFQNRVFTVERKYNFWPVFWNLSVNAVSGCLVFFF